MLNVKRITVGLAAAIAIPFLLTSCSGASTNPTPTSTKTAEGDAFVNQNGNCGNLVNLFTDSIDEMKAKGITERYTFGETVYVTVYNPEEKPDNYVGVRYDKESDGYYKVPTLENFALVGDFEKLNADTNICVNDSKNQMTITTSDSNTITVTTSNGLITAIDATDSENNDIKKAIFYGLDDKAKSFYDQNVQD